jgi:predicted kinase
MLIVLSGLPGVGKTAIARALAVAISAVHLRIDSIEQALRACGVDVEEEGYAVAYAIAEDNLRLGHTVIADCVNPWSLTRDEWRSAGERAGARVVEVEVICSNIEEHKRRVETRSTDIKGHRLPTWSEVLERDYRPWDRERMILDTAQLDVRECVRTIEAAVSTAAHLPGVPEIQGPSAAG